MQMREMKGEKEKSLAVAGLSSLLPASLHPVVAPRICFERLHLVGRVGGTDPCSPGLDLGCVSQWPSTGLA